MSQKRTQLIAAVQSIIGYTFNDEDILWEALQAPGSGVFSAGTRRITNEGNKRLALVGDAWMKAVMVNDWFASGLPRGAADRAFQCLSNTNLERMGRAYGLDKYVNGNPSQFGIVSPRTMADTVEAIMGAVVEDGQDTALRKVMGRLGLLASAAATEVTQPVLRL